MFCAQLPARNSTLAGFDHRQKGIVEVDLRYPGNSAEYDVFDAGLGGCGHRYGIAVATETSRYPKNIDLRNDACVPSLAFRLTHTNAPSANSHARSKSGGTVEGVLQDETRVRSLRSFVAPRMSRIVLRSTSIPRQKTRPSAVT